MLEIVDAQDCLSSYWVIHLMTEYFKKQCMKSVRNIRGEKAPNFSYPENRKIWILEKNQIL